MPFISDAPKGSLRERAALFVDSPAIRYGILALIVFNAITLGLSTSDVVRDNLGGALRFIDSAVIVVFVLEMVLKLYAYGWRFFRNAWNIFDLSIVVIAVLPSTAGLSVLRALRVIRAMRILSVVPQLRSVIRALLEALPGMGAVIILLGIVYYVFAVMTTMLYGDAYPQWFGTIGESLYSLFQIMTLESWSMGIVRVVMEQYPQAWLLFVPFIVMTAFAVLNLFIGILVNTMQSAVEEAQDQELERILKIVTDGNEATQAALADIRKQLEARDGR
ncbi:ion transporter [Abyssibius alkaniclasticus]|uniref:ion transporter n=1 Tax=Abyssibius alkaniclasticus TaxID=2881234 RepID=UPI002363DBBA|nr:ion transporter [Abyssibius alkaniclasticus]UPH72388.1 ion transporter [Abyssibius alkaniclasticus]